MKLERFKKKGCNVQYTHIKNSTRLSTSRSRILLQQTPSRRSFRTLNKARVPGGRARSPWLLAFSSAPINTSPASHQHRCPGVFPTAIAKRDLHKGSHITQMSSSTQPSLHNNPKHEPSFPRQHLLFNGQPKRFPYHLKRQTVNQTRIDVTTTNPHTNKPLGNWQSLA